MSARSKSQKRPKVKVLACRHRDDGSIMLEVAFVDPLAALHFVEVLFLPSDAGYVVNVVNRHVVQLPMAVLNG